MICKTLDQLENELAETIQRISKITDVGDFYKVQRTILDYRTILDHRENKKLGEAVPDTKKLLFYLEVVSLGIKQLGTNLKYGANKHVLFNLLLTTNIKMCFTSFTVPNMYYIWPIIKILKIKMRC